MIDLAPLRQAQSSANLQAWLRVIRAGESGQVEEAYRALYGWRPGNGQTFEGFADHPRQAFRSAWGWTSAAGAYQAMCLVPGRVATDTWGDFVKACGPHDFSPASQDIFATWCTWRRGALADVLAGRLAEAIRKCCREWASLPGSPYGQPVRSLAQAVATFKQYGGTDTPSAPAKPASGPPGPVAEAVPPLAIPTPPEKPAMPLPAILGALLPNLIQAVPVLAKLFGSGTEVAERNVKGAEIALQIAQDTLGARNAQEAVEMVKADQAAAVEVSKAIEARWLDLVEAGGDGIAGARKANAAYSMPEGPRFWLNPAFWISLILLAMPLMLLVDVFFIHPAGYAREDRTQVITAVLLVIGMVGGYWIGTSFSSAKKDERQAPPVG